jgi:iron complex outermembrane receptor protein
MAVLAIVVCLSLTFRIQGGEAAQNPPDDLTALSLEDLMNIEVTSVSKKGQKLSDAAAAIFVITQEDIRRSGVTSIPEALRMAPGLQVAHIDANKWAITARGFNGRWGNKLLVLIDGRTVYSPLFSGVVWELQDMMLEDIERIEVIRGPGAALWGSNAVNGVINVITKHTKDTQGGLITAGFGTEERGFGAARYGGKVDDNLTYRLYAKYFDRDGFVEASGRDGSDDWRAARGGFRMDYQPTGKDSLTLQGDIYGSNDGQRYETPSLFPPFSESFSSDSHFSGGNTLARWSHVFSSSSDMSLQLYYDRMEPDDELFKMTVDIFDLDFQHQFKLGDRQQIMWGFGYRFARSSADNSFVVSFDPVTEENNLISAFVQDEIGLWGDQLKLILGSKFEHNDFTGFEIQPNARLLYAPNKRNTLWTAASRAVRTPSFGERDIVYNSQVVPPGSEGNPSPFPLLVQALGNRELSSEEVTAFELGYRFQPTDRLSFDIATFYNLYDNLIAGEVGDTIFVATPVPHLVTQILTQNHLEGATYGAELATEYKLFQWWRLQGAYTYLQLDLEPEEDSSEQDAAGLIEGRSPRHQLSMRSWMELPYHLELDLWLRYVDSLTTGDIPSYTTLDVRLGWRPCKALELSIVGQNLLESHHPEFVPDFINSIPTEVPRGVYGKVSWRF